MYKTTIAVLKAIQDHVKEQEKSATYPLSPPSLRQIMAVIDRKSTSVVNLHITRLVEEGYLVRGHRNTAHMTKKGRFAVITKRDGKLVLNDVMHKSHDGSAVWNG